jgi:hypothetical protein
MSAYIWKLVGPPRSTPYEIVGARSTGDTSYNHHPASCVVMHYLFTKYLGRGETTNLEWDRRITSHVEEGTTVIFLRKYLRIILKSKIQHTQTPLETSRRDNCPATNAKEPQEKENYR